MRKEAINTTGAPEAIGPYSQAIKVGDLLFISGQLGIDPSTGKMAGRSVKKQVEQAFSNIAAILFEAGGSMNSVVKTTVYLTNMDKFAEMNEIYEKKFRTPFPARSSIAVRGLPKGGVVEVEVIAVIKE
ncbi:MAG: Rid family detoxifying hydrolase [Bacteroidales bacterium]|jgi:2-iminobutanoate/2-iminopropanoate deaminase|nr:Rid family detoxifying hydrolase [Bacteroidales bacterium]